MQRSSLESKLDASRHDRDRLALQLGAANKQIEMRDAALAASHSQAFKQGLADLQLQVWGLLTAHGRDPALPEHNPAVKGVSRGSGVLLL